MQVHSKGSWKLGEFLDCVIIRFLRFQFQEESSSMFEESKTKHAIWHTGFCYYHISGPVSSFLEPLTDLFTVFVTKNPFFSVLSGRSHLSSLWMTALSFILFLYSAQKLRLVTQHTPP